MTSHGDGSLARLDVARVTELAEQRECLVACRGEVVLGTIPLDGSDLVTFFVAPSAQGCGVGYMLLSALEEVAFARQVREIHLETALAGVGFYEARGFQRTGRLVQGHAGEHVEMTKAITRAAAL